MRLIVLFMALLALSTGAAARPQKPRLVVNIVVSGMRYDYISRFGANFGDNGFRRFREGMVFTDAQYSHARTTTGAGLATLTTGAQPAMHGIISSHWTDYVNGRSVSLIDDPAVRGLECDDGVGQYSPANVMVPTLGDRLIDESPKSKVITIAADPLSSVVMGGRRSSAYWMDRGRCTWVSSSAYMDGLPQWVNNFNSLRYGDTFLPYDWRLFRHMESYVNEDHTVIDISGEGRPGHSRSWQNRNYHEGYDGLPDTPAGNTMVKDFAKQAIIYEDLGKDHHTDMLNICFDTPRRVGEMFGPGSLELEDMYYRLDEEVADLLDFIFAQVPRGEVLVVLTADHGTSDSFDGFASHTDRFNEDQFKVIVNGFMNAQWGEGDWVLDLVDRQLYLNRNLIYRHGLSLEEVQNRVAAFALQFRGVSHVLTATALTGSYFGSGYARKIQNAFYPRRSGDIMLVLMPGWIMERESVRSQSGSMYGYDTHVPLMMMGAGLPAGRIDGMTDMTSVAPTLARIMKISRPIASEGAPLHEIADLFDHE